MGGGMLDASLQVPPGFIVMAGKVGAGRDGMRSTVAGSSRERETVSRRGRSEMPAPQRLRAVKALKFCQLGWPNLTPAPPA